jgi:hypothetical protein
VCEACYAIYPLYDAILQYTIETLVLDANILRDSILVRLEMVARTFTLALLLTCFPSRLRDSQSPPFGSEVGWLARQELGQSCLGLNDSRSIRSTTGRVPDAQASHLRNQKAAMEDYILFFIMSRRILHVFSFKLPWRHMLLIRCMCRPGCLKEER